MTTQTRKAREVAEREELLLDLAIEIIEEHSFAQLTMDKLTARSEYSKGTVYNHFSSKEDLWCALCARGLRIQKSMFGKLANFEGNSRERILALSFGYELFTLCYPILTMVSLRVMSPAVFEKASPARIKALGETEDEMVEMLKGMIETAMANNELSRRYEDNLYQVTFAIWAMSFGSVTILRNSTPTPCLERIDIDSAVLVNASIVLDGLQWQPYSWDWDYKASWQRIAEEIFYEELATLNK
ncbi:TetR/AcrR family transcriptional regulator [Motilimonas cestriensis]|uniref:TetR/AcrR family transcriptional regulator n=1 Tax=Motilimonas cestriensis TaxID=2742685 RepID=A0ABS8W7U4_9GAMM|nr:TetR/AcrR family transcriptional regulator [Motilimonas cestriensis]MCE2594293.1 TetR/AcrR family transcriptional regulator [Motilimonas cestriensis]